MANITGVNPPVLNDTDYVDKIENSFNAIDDHDHSSGKGVPIASGGIANGAVTEANLATVLANAGNFLVRNGSGVVVSNTKAVPSGTVVGTTDAQSITAKTLLEVDNLRLDGNTLSSTDTNGAVNITPNGTGQISMVGGNVTVSTAGLITTTNNLIAVNVNGGNLRMGGITTETNKIVSTDSNGAISFDPNGTGIVETIGTGITVPEIATPATPASGKAQVYAKSDNFLYHINDAGSEQQVVGATATQTLTNKTLSGNTAATLISGSGTLTLNTTGTITVPNATDTLVGKTTTDTLTNKTLTSPVVNTGTINDGVYNVLNFTDDGTPSTPSSGTTKVYTKTDGKLYKLTSAGVEQEVGSGASSSSGKNYLSANPDAETSTTGWTTYADAAGSSPVDGTGGSPTVTWTRSTTTPLRGTADFNFTKDAANRQGEGVAYAFTLDSADKGKVISISFDYEYISGTYSNGTSSTDSDLTVYLYDVTNSQVIQPVNHKIAGVVSGAVGKHTAHFQTSASGTSYRFIVHVATTSASAYVVAFDNFFVGPSINVMAAPLTDPITFTPTGSWSTNTTYTGQYWRVGKHMKGWVKLALAGAPTSATLTVNLPSGFSIDTAAADADTDNWTLGKGNVLDSGVASYLCRLRYSSTTAFQVEYLTSSDVFAAVTQAAPITFGASDEIHLEFEVPISGWSGNVNVLGADESRVVAMRASGNPASATAGNVIIFPTADFDTHGLYNTTTGRYTVPLSGTYQVSGYAESATAAINLRIYKNAVADIYVATTPSNGDIGFHGIIQANAGDILDLRPDGTIDLLSTSNLCISRLSGPEAISASESVNCKFTKISQSVNNGNTDVISGVTKVYDSHGGLNTTSGVYTVPVSGKYRVSGNIVSTSTAWTVGTGRYAALKVTGTQTEFLGYGTVWASITTFLTAGGGSTLDLVAGNTISFSIDNSSGSTYTQSGATSDNHFQIERVGN